MTRNEIETKVIDIAINHTSVKNIKLNSDIIEDLALDSLEIVELIMDVEKEFSVAIPDDVSDSIRTIEDVINYVEKYI